tara:strand:+ start:14 stop:1027 length:1014 start_codon:yes stop_codon:yes gene_type:complete
MADKKITALTSLGAAPADGDMIPIVDVSDTSDSSAGTTKHILASDLLTDVSQVSNSSARYLGAVYSAKSTAGNMTYTAAEFLGKVIFRDCNGADRTDVTPTAAEIVAAITNPANGDHFRVVIRNNSQGSGESLTLNGGTGVTRWGDSTIKDTYFGEFVVVLDNVSSGSEAVSIYSVHNQSFASASETAEGLVELATTGEASTGTDTARAVTPAGVKAAVPAQICIACSDETTALTTGTAKTTFRMPAAMTLTAVRATVTTAPAGSVLTVDINEGGSTILSTKLTIDASEKTSTSAATAAVISDSALADDAEITIDIDGVGSGTAGAGLKVWLIGTWT